MPQLFRRSAAALAVLFMVLSASQASAALISRIVWQVDGGTFDSVDSIAKGDITGGSLTFLTPGRSFSTYYTSTSGGTWNLVLSGPSGFFRMNLAPGTGYFYLYGAVSAYGNFSGTPAAASGPSAGALVANQVLFTSGYYGYMFFTAFTDPFQYGFVYGYSGNDGNRFTHNFTLGNEVRVTVIPEPATGTLFGLGLVGLGVYAAGRGSSARLRRRGPA